jgi:GTP-binding protein
MTNIRSSTSDIAIKLTPPILFSLEQAIDFINRDELAEITPEHIRLRKKTLQETMRLREISAERRSDEDAD